jgi:hypothetical protein
MVNGKCPVKNYYLRLTIYHLPVFVYTCRSLLGNVLGKAVKRSVLIGNANCKDLKLYVNFKFFEKDSGGSERENMKTRAPRLVQSERYRFCSTEIPACENSTSFYFGNSFRR